MRQGFAAALNSLLAEGVFQKFPEPAGGADRIRRDLAAGHSLAHQQDLARRAGGGAWLDRLPSEIVRDACAADRAALRRAARRRGAGDAARTARLRRHAAVRHRLSALALSTATRRCRRDCRRSCCGRCWWTIRWRPIPGWRIAATRMQETIADERDASVDRRPDRSGAEPSRLHRLRRASRYPHAGGFRSRSCRALAGASAHHRRPFAPGAGEDLALSPHVAGQRHAHGCLAEGRQPARLRPAR